MVLIEMLVGKGAAAAGMGAVKMASAGSTGTAMSLLQPTHDLMRGVSHFAPPENLSSLFTGLDTVADSLAHSVQSAAATLSLVSPSSVVGAAAFMGTLGGFHSFGILKVSQVSSWFTGEEEEGERKPTGFNCSIRPSIALMCFSDALTSAALFSSIGAPLDVPLRTFAAGSLLLSFPATWLTDSIARYWEAVAGEEASRGGVLSELLVTAGAFAWLAFGTHLISITQTAGQNAPLLFWNTFIQCSAAWSCLTFGILGLIISTVMQVSMGQSQK